MSTLVLCSFTILLIVSFANANPMKIMELQPIILSAPISQIQWNFRGNWKSNSEPEEPDARSYHIQHAMFSDFGRRKEKIRIEKLDETTESNYPEDDQTMVPNLMEYSVVHPKSFGARPKALHISVEPSKDENVPKLHFNDSFLDAIKKLATTESPRRPTTVKRTRKPTPTTKRPKPQDRPRPKPLQYDTGKQVNHSELMMQSEEETPETNTTDTSTMSPATTAYSNNILYGSSQVGNRESQMVIKPTVIVNFRGTVSNTDRDISLESRSAEDDFTNGTKIIPQGVFNINQEVNIDRTFSMPGQNEESEKPCRTKPRLDVNVIEKKGANEDNNGELKIQASIKPEDTSKTSNHVKKYRMSGDFRNVEEETNYNGYPQEYLPKQYYVVQLGPLAGFINFKHF